MIQCGWSEVHPFVQGCFACAGLTIARRSVNGAKRSGLFSLSGSSTIISPYHDSSGGIVGVIGVIGPTRLNYARIVPMVDYTAKVVSKLLAPN